MPCTVDGTAQVEVLTNRQKLSKGRQTEKKRQRRLDSVDDILMIQLNSQISLYGGISASDNGALQHDRSNARLIASPPPAGLFDSISRYLYIMYMCL